MPRKAVAEIMATLALLGVTISLSGGLALTYYGWLHSYSSQSAVLGGEAARLGSSRVYVVATAAGSPARVWILNSGGAPSNITELYADGSLLLAGQWRLFDSVTGSNSTSLLPGHLYQIAVNATRSIVAYFDGTLSVGVVLGP
jgi:hypothetical protein